MIEYLFCDSNEAAVQPKIVESLRKSIPVKIKKLPCGDYFISPIIIERKTSSDFLRSISDGALFDQVKRMKSVEFAMPLLLIEGSFVKALKFSKWNLSSLNGALCSLAIDWNIQMIYTANQFHTINLLTILYKHATSKKDRKIIPLTIKTKALTLAEKQRRILESYPNIGPICAHALLEYFDSIINFVNSSIEDLCNVKGIGEKTAKEIFDLNRSSYISQV
jgi:ERCC4-type nuclease